MLNTPAAPTTLAKDFSEFLSIDAKAHKPSALKAFFPIMQRPGMLSLAGGKKLTSSQKSDLRSHFEEGRHILMTLFWFET
jgi:hypothetical protein